jgi:hypothetical protein
MIIIYMRFNRIKFANFLYETRVLDFETLRCFYELTNKISKYIFIEYNRFRYIRNFFRNIKNYLDFRKLFIIRVDYERTNR